MKHNLRGRLWNVGSNAQTALGDASGMMTEGERLVFEPREVGSAEQLMLSRTSAGYMITTHCFVAVLDGFVDSERLQDALQWATIRHPMLRSVVKPPDVEKTNDFGPFFHGGKDGRWTWMPSNLTVAELVARALIVEDFDAASGNDFSLAWRKDFEATLDKSTFDLTSGPLWRLKLLRHRKPSGDHESVLLVSFIHSLSDQKSANVFLNDLLEHMAAAERGQPLSSPEPLPHPKSLEDVFLVDELDVQKLAEYALSQAEAGGKPSVLVPSALRSPERTNKKHWALDPTQPVAKDRSVVVPSVPAEGDFSILSPQVTDPETVFDSQRRNNLVSMRQLSAHVVEKLRNLCRQNNVTISHAAAVAALLAASDVAHDDLDFGYEAYRLLLGVDMRRFAPDGDWTSNTLAFASGALDFTIRLLPSSGTAYAQEHAENGSSLRALVGGVPFWDLARASRHAVEQWVKKGYAAESTRLFDLGVKNLRMENIIRATANTPATLGRAYSVTVSNAGVYGMGPTDLHYGNLRLSGLFFGISTAVSGSMVAASTLTVNGELQLTAHGSTPIVNRTELDTFADSMIRSLTIASEAPWPQRKGGGMPRVENPIDPRAGKPWYYPVETDKGSLRCPTYEEIRSPTLRPFDVDKYVGIWYELAFHDITQFNGCGCTRFNMTRHGTVIEDMFTVSCPWPWREGVDGPWLPGFGSNGQRRLNQWTCNMTMFYQPARPGVMRETGFGQAFDNMVLEIWSDPEITAETGYEYTRAIQFQCLGSSGTTGITFVGINFLSRTPIVKPAMLQEMFVRARALGLEPYGSNDMHIVEHQGCKYPRSTDTSWMGERPEWPYPIFQGELGALV